MPQTLLCHPNIWLSRAGRMKNSRWAPWTARFLSVSSNIVWYVTSLTRTFPIIMWSFAVWKLTAWNFSSRRWTGIQHHKEPIHHGGCIAEMCKKRGVSFQWYQLEQWYKLTIFLVSMCRGSTCTLTTLFPGAQSHWAWLWGHEDEPLQKAGASHPWLWS